MTLEDIEQRLKDLSEEMTALIRQYEMDAESPLHVIENARERITKQEDYVRFLELSLEGRILADEGQRLIRARQNLH